MPIHDVLRQRVQPLTATLTSNRIFLYCIFSSFAVLATIANACRAHSNFYSVSIYLSKSSRTVLILANFGFICSLLFGRLLQKIFFGALQPREVERLYDQTWMFVTESLLAFTIFRDEFDVPFLLMFGFLLFVKCFHWLMADRVESMDQTTYPGPPSLFHIRINSLFFVLWAVDTIMFVFAVESTLTNGVGGMVLFASEYAILLASALNAMLRYTLSILDLRRARARGGENAPPWENKSMYIFYIELLTDFLKLATYMTFFMIILTFYGLPLNIIRDVFVTARSFITRLRALVRYHNATRDMDRRYPDATEAELAEMSDRTCIICREEMQPRNPVPHPDGAGENGEQQQQHPPPLPPVEGPNMTPKKLPCGHIFHFQCLRSWLERQQSCPTCRRTVLENNPAPNQAQAPAQGQPRPARPRPGAVPIPGAAQGQQGAAGPLGWVGRFLGLPLQAPALDPQFPGAQGQFQQGPPQPFQQQPLPNAAWGAPIPGQAVPPPPPFYEPMPGWQHQVPGHPPQQQLQPPPIFRGFYGPGQAWQPWGDPRWYAPHAQQGAQQQQQNSEPLPVTSDTSHQVQDQGTSVQTPGVPQPPPSVSNGVDYERHGRTERIQPSAKTPTPTTGSDSNSFMSELDTQRPTSADERPSDARAAATLAALRRRQNGSAAPGSSSSSAVATSGWSTSVSTSDASAEPASTATVAAVTEPAGQAKSSSSAPAPSSSTTLSDVPPTSQETPTPNIAPPLPPLVPLYDPSIVRPPAAHGPYYAPYNYYYNSPYAHSSGVYPGPSHGQPSRMARSGAMGARTPLVQLPRALTDEQLARLDRLTREAIDERLRVLEGVSGAVYRCVEELTRVRSVLPQSGLDPSSSSGSDSRREAAQGQTEASTSASIVTREARSNGKDVDRGETVEGSVSGGNASGPSSSSETDDKDAVVEVDLNSVGSS